jgi:hypothetical protein
VINAAGAGYVVGDIVTIAGGTALQAAKVRVMTIGGGGAVTGVKLLLGGGSYTANPASPNTPTGGTGAGLTLNLTFASQRLDHPAGQRLRHDREGAHPQGHRLRRGRDLRRHPHLPRH